MSPTARVQHKAVQKYLERHAEPEAAIAMRSLLAGRTYQDALCIPAFGEGKNLFECLGSLSSDRGGSVLILLIINETAASPEWATRANRELVDAVAGQLGSPSRVESHLRLFTHPLGDLLLVDRTRREHPLPNREGVGLARKIISDIALALWAAGQLDSDWIHCSDADALLPADYFSRARARPSPASSGKPNSAALVYDFMHTPAARPAEADAVLRYEIYLRYYVLGLRSAGSPYAYQSIGSTLAIAPVAYAQVRGFPKRNAGEDFHLLSKLAKLGRIEPLRGDPLVLSGRISERVPFGTGVGVAREVQRIADGEIYPAFDPCTFLWLKVWLDVLRNWAQAEAANRMALRDAILQKESAISDSLTREPAPPQVNRENLVAVLGEVGAISAAEAGADRGIRHQFECFDALRTLQFLHCVRDRHLPEIQLEVAVREAPFIQLPETLPNVREDASKPENAFDPTLFSMRAALTRLEAQSGRDAA